jgi:hypothetical protein
MKFEFPNAQIGIFKIVTQKLPLRYVYGHGINMAHQTDEKVDIPEAGQ